MKALWATTAVHIQTVYQIRRPGYLSNHNREPIFSVLIHLVFLIWSLDVSYAHDAHNNQNAISSRDKYRAYLVSVNIEIHFHSFDTDFFYVYFTLCYFPRMNILYIH